MKRGRAIWQAYRDCGALEVTCPHCAATPGQWCTRADGRVRRIPCASRTVASIGSGAGRPYSRDFSEPTHPNPIEERNPT